MKYVSIRIPEDGPLGEILLEARARAIAGAFFVKSPAGGCVESVLTLDTQRFFLEPAMRPPSTQPEASEMRPIQSTVLVEIIGHFLFELTVDT